LQLEFLSLLAQNLILDLAFKAVHRLLEQDQKSARAIQLVDELVTLFKEASRDDVFDVFRLVLNAAVQLADFLILHVDGVQVVLFFLAGQISARFELLLAIGDNLSAEVLNCIVEVLPSEDYTGARCECFDLGAAIGELGQELLHEVQFLDHVKVLVWIDFVVESRRKLLEWVDAHLDLGLGEVEAAGEGGVLGVERLNRSTRDVFFDFIRENHDLSLRCIEAVEGDFLLLSTEFLFQFSDHFVAVLLLSGRC